MKKIGLLFLSITVLSTMNVFAASNCNDCPSKKQAYSAPYQKPCEKPCEKKMYTRPCPVDTFLCTGKDKDKMYKCLNLTDTQICTADKINDKYEIEVLSLNEKIKCENKRLYDLKQTCYDKKEYRKIKRNLKNLKKERKEICKCYEKQFKAILSNQQIREYRKYKKQ
ncbi:hypothetical protein IJ182_02410 [bacterium]|nr:hypothetical protein [bacterium]